MRRATRIFLVSAVLVALIAGAAFVYFMPGYLPAAPGAVPVDPTTQTINKGEYLARAGDCVACHTAPGGKQFAGGRVMAIPFGRIYVPTSRRTTRPASVGGPPTTSIE
jgi:hypothetical protein